MEGLDLDNQALEICELLGTNEWRIKCSLDIGWIYRVTGSIDQAQKYYTQALKWAFEINDDAKTALICSQLAYVDALMHQEKAFGEVQLAIREWQSLIQKKRDHYFRLGQCYNIAGEIFLEMDRLNEALEYFDLSWTIFSMEEGEEGRLINQEWKSKARSGKGFTYCQLAFVELEKKGNTKIAEDYLHSALAELEWAVQNATYLDIPSVQNRLGEVFFLWKLYPETEQAFCKGMKIARDIGDAFNEFHSLCDLTRLAFFLPLQQFKDWKELEIYFRIDYHKRYPTFYFEHITGLFYTNLGHLALREFTD